MNVQRNFVHLHPTGTVNYNIDTIYYFRSSWLFKVELCDWHISVVRLAFLSCVCVCFEWCCWGCIVFQFVVELELCIHLVLVSLIYGFSSASLRNLGACPSPGWSFLVYSYWLAKNLQISDNYMEELCANMKVGCLPCFRCIMDVFSNKILILKSWIVNNHANSWNKLIIWMQMMWTRLNVNLWFPFFLEGFKKTLEQCNICYLVSWSPTVIFQSYIYVVFFGTWNNFSLIHEKEEKCSRIQVPMGKKMYNTNRKEPKSTRG